MRFSLARVLILLFAGLPILFRPSAGRAYIECADGTSCAELAKAPQPRPCCKAKPCAKHVDPTPGKRCVLKIVAPVDATLDRAVVVDLDHHPLLFAPAAVIDVEPLPPAGRFDVVEPIPPPSRLAAKQCHGPRAPPSFQV